MQNSGKQGTKTVTLRVDTASHGVEILLILQLIGRSFVEPAPTREDKFPSPSHKSFHIHPQFRQTGDENGYRPGRYRPGRVGNPMATLGISLIG